MFLKLFILQLIICVNVFAFGNADVDKGSTLSNDKPVVVPPPPPPPSPPVIKQNLNGTVVNKSANNATRPAASSSQSHSDDLNGSLNRRGLKFLGKKFIIEYDSKKYDFKGQDSVKKQDLSQELAKVIASHVSLIRMSVSVIPDTSLYSEFNIDDNNLMQYLSSEDKLWERIGSDNKEIVDNKEKIIKVAIGTVLKEFQKKKEEQKEEEQKRIIQEEQKKQASASNSVVVQLSSSPHTNTPAAPPPPPPPGQNLNGMGLGNKGSNTTEPATSSSSTKPSVVPLARPLINQNAILNCQGSLRKTKSSSQVQTQKEEFINSIEKYLPQKYVSRSIGNDVFIEVLKEWQQVDTLSSQIRANRINILAEEYDSENYDTGGGDDELKAKTMLLITKAFFEEVEQVNVEVVNTVIVPTKVVVQSGSEELKVQNSDLDLINPAVKRELLHLKQNARLLEINHLTQALTQLGKNPKEKEKELRTEFDKKKIEFLAQKKDELSRESSELGKEIGNEQKKVQEINNEISELEKKMNNVQGGTYGKAKKTSILKSEYNKLMNEESVVKANNIVLDTKLIINKSKVIAVEKQIILAKLDKVRNGIHTLPKSSSNEQLLDKNKEEIKDWQEEYTRLADQHKMLKSEFTTLKTKLNEINIELNNEKEEVIVKTGFDTIPKTTSKKKSDEYENGLKRSKDEINKLKSEFKELEKENSSVINESKLNFNPIDLSKLKENLEKLTPHFAQKTAVDNAVRRECNEIKLIINTMSPQKPEITVGDIFSSKTMNMMLSKIESELESEPESERWSGSEIEFNGGKEEKKDRKKRMKGNVQNVVESHSIDNKVPTSDAVKTGAEFKQSVLQEESNNEYAKVVDEKKFAFVLKIIDDKAKGVSSNQQQKPTIVQNDPIVIQKPKSPPVPPKPQVKKDVRDYVKINDNKDNSEKIINENLKLDQPSIELAKKLAGSNQILDRQSSVTGTQQNVTTAQSHNNKTSQINDHSGLVQRTENHNSIADELKLAYQSDNQNDTDDEGYGTLSRKKYLKEVVVREAAPVPQRAKEVLLAVPQKAVVSVVPQGSNGGGAVVSQGAAVSVASQGSNGGAVVSQGAVVSVVPQGSNGGAVVSQGAAVSVASQGSNGGVVVSQGAAVSVASQGSNGEAVVSQGAVVSVVPQGSNGGAVVSQGAAVSVASQGSNGGAVVSQGAAVSVVPQGSNGGGAVVSQGAAASVVPQGSNGGGAVVSQGAAVSVAPQGSNGGAAVVPPQGAAGAAPQPQGAELKDDPELYLEDGVLDDMLFKDEEKGKEDQGGGTDPQEPEEKLNGEAEVVHEVAPQGTVVSQEPEELNGVEAPKNYEEPKPTTTSNNNLLSIASLAKLAVTEVVNTVSYIHSALNYRVVNIVNFFTVAAGDEEIKARKGAWISGIYNIAKQGVVQDIPGYRSVGGGVAVGFDVELNNNLLGIAYSNVGSNFKFNNNILNKVSVQGHVISLYGYKDLKHNFALQGVYSLSFNNIKYKIANNIKDSGYYNSYKTKNISHHLETRLNYKIYSNKGFIVIPNIGIKYNRLHNNIYSESDVAIHNLSLSKKPRDLITGVVGASLFLQPKQVSRSIRITPALHANIEKNFNIKGKNIYLLSDKKHSDKTIILSKQAKMSYNVGASLLMESKNIAIRLEYNCHMHKKYKSNQGVISLKLAF